MAIKLKQILSSSTTISMALIKILTLCKAPIIELILLSKSMPIEDQCGFVLIAPPSSKL